MITRGQKVDMEQELRFNELFIIYLKDCRDESIAKEEDNKGNPELGTIAAKKRTLDVPTKGARGVRKQPTTCNRCQETFRSSLEYNDIFI